jgi:hypothetical protein
LKSTSIYTSCAILILLFGGNVFGADNPTSESLLPAGLTMEDVFKPGLGASVGKIEMAQGQVVIIHADELRGYQARKDLPLYTGDTIVTLETGRTRFKLNDESTVTIAPETKLVINQSVYDPAKKSRTSFMGMSVGKARFLVKKLTDFQRSVFKVKTPTAVCGVRGSDFIATVTTARTEFTALDKTFLEVLSLAFPEKEPLTITSFERAIVETTAIWKEAITPEEIERLQKLFTDIAEMLEAEEVKEPPEAPPEEPPRQVSEEEVVAPPDPEEPKEISRAEIVLIRQRGGSKCPVHVRVDGEVACVLPEWGNWTRFTLEPGERRFEVFCTKRRSTCKPYMFKIEASVIHYFKLHHPPRDVRAPKWEISKITEGEGENLMGLKDRFEYVSPVGSEQH